MEDEQRAENAPDAGSTPPLTGNQDIDDDALWDAYVTRIRELGLDAYLAVMQTVYDRDWRDVYPASYTPLPQRTE